MVVWLEDLSTKADSTRRAYLRNFDRFCDRWGYDADSLFEARKVDLNSLDSRDHQNIERKVKVLFSEMTAKGYSPNSVRQVSKAVASFLESQGLELKLKAKDQPRAPANGQSLALVEHIRLMWDEVGTEMRERNRALMAVAKDSGLRVSDIALMDLEDWNQAQIFLHGEEVFKVFFPKKTKKTGEIAYIHLGPEAVNAIEEYLKVRDSDDQALFLDRSGKRVTEDALSRQFKYLGLKTGHKKISAHSFRKFHRTRLEGAGIPEGWVKRLQGKKASVYSHPEETGELTQKYLECYNALRIFGPKADAEKIKYQDERIKELEAELELLQAKIPGYQEILKRLEALEVRL